MGAIVAGHQALLGSVGGPDPSFGFVEILLHGDNPTGNVAPVDVGGRTWSVNGTAEIVTNESVFGGGSLYLPASGDSYFHTSQSLAALEPGSGAFAIEAWIRLETGAIGAIRAIVSNYVNNTTGMSFQVDSAGKLIFNASGDGVDVQGVAVLAEETWYFVQALGDGAGNITLGIDGVQDATAAVAYNITSSGRFAVGRAGEVAVNYFYGWIDDVRYTVGATRSLTLPVNPFPDN